MAVAQTKDYLEPLTLAAIDSIELRARLIVEGLSSGMHRSPLSGASVEFAQHRQYAPGDDLRHLDWKVYGRTDKLYLKQHQKETNLDLLVLVDASGSMTYGSVTGNGTTRTGRPSWRKIDHAVSLAAAISYLALKQQDRVGLMMFGHGDPLATRVSGARGHWRSIVEALSSGVPALGHAAAPSRHAEPEGGDSVDLARLFDQVVARHRRRSLAVLISDLFDTPEAFERGLALMHHRGHDVVIMQTLDPAERTFSFRSPADFVGLEGEGRLRLDPAALRKAYLDAIRQHTTRLRQIARRFRFDLSLLDSSEPLGPPLGRFLARRASMVRRQR